jgi:glutamate synthase domain-containing protein 2
MRRIGTRSCGSTRISKATATSRRRERPFSRDQRRWVYASAKREINTFGFGTDNEMEEIDSLVVFKHSPFPAPAPAKGEAGAAPDYRVPAGKVLGAARRRRHACRPASIVNISGMSYGSLSPVAVEALNRGAQMAGCLHNTGEGGVAEAHRHGGELIYQIGTGYFGCRDERGRFRCSGCSSGWRRRRCGRSRSSSPRAPSPASAVCCRRRR